MPSDTAKNCDGAVYNRQIKASMVFRRLRNTATSLAPFLYVLFKKLTPDN